MLHPTAEWQHHMRFFSRGHLVPEGVVTRTSELDPLSSPTLSFQCQRLHLYYCFRTLRIIREKIILKRDWGEITPLSYAKTAIISLELLQRSAAQFYCFTLKLPALRQSMCSVLSRKWHLVSYWGKHSSYVFFWCLLPSYCSHLQSFCWWDLTSPLKKAGNLHMLKTGFYCEILTIWIQHPYFISF